MAAILVAGLFIGSSGTQRVFSQLGNTFLNQECGVSIEYPTGWKATESQFVFEDKSKTLADFQSQDDDIFALYIAIEDLGLAEKSLAEISEFQKEFVSLNPDSIVMELDLGQINGFPSYKIIYREGLVGKYESQEDKFHTMEILIIAHNREYKFAFEAADKAEFDKYRSTVEDMDRTIKISEPKFEGIKC